MSGREGGACDMAGTLSIANFAGSEQLTNFTGFLADFYVITFKGFILIHCIHFSPYSSLC